MNDKTDITGTADILPGAIITEYEDPPPRTLAPTGTADMLLSPAAMDGLERAAKLMAHAKIMMPQHLQGSPGDCLGVLMQATQWRMNPYALAQKTFLVSGRIGYEAQAIKAAIDSSPQLASRLRFEWFGDWDHILGNITTRKGQRGDVPAAAWSPDDEHGLGVICYGLLRGETEPRELELRMTQAHPRNSPLWVTDPKQQLAYLATKRWARLHLPEVLLGVYDDGETEEIAINAPEPPVIEMPKRKQKPAPTPAKSKPSNGNSAPNEIQPLELGIRAAIDAASNLDDLTVILADINELPSNTEKKTAHHYWQARKDELGV